MAHKHSDARLRFIVTLVCILGVIAVTLVVTLLVFDQASYLVTVILAVAVLLGSVLAISLGYNVFVRVHDAAGGSNEFKATRPEEE